MKTNVQQVDCNEPQEDVIAQAAAILQEGGLVAFPTETVYGLGGNGLDAAACKKIYEAKGRPSDNPLILHISHQNELERIVSDVPEAAKKIMDAFWPGPITLIFPKADCVPMETTGGLDTVAVRFPAHKVAQALIRKAGLPIAAPSANSSGKPSPTRASHVEYDLGGKIAMILDGGSCEVGLESTILDVSVKQPILLRPGAITKEMIEKVIGPIAVDAAVLEKPQEGVAPKAPGMKYTHYSPKAEVILVAGSTLEAQTQEICRLVEEQLAQGKKVGILATEQTKAAYPKGIVLSVGDRQKLETIGANLFKVLRKFDFLGVDIIFSEVFDTTGEGMAIMNRLNKAAGYHIVEV
jgi:L-threonylcarbamoyladenylate synthase